MMRLPFVIFFPSKRHPAIVNVDQSILNIKEAQLILCLILQKKVMPAILNMGFLSFIKSSVASLFNWRPGCLYADFVC